ncbi:MAG: 2-5 ligase, partial [Belnapia sp.]|nr:2-5 ligase [Belnapia sp.]
LAHIRARPFELSLRGLGTFEKAGRISALWVGVEKTEALAFLQAKVETALQRLGLEPERKRFAPHVTLARTERAPPDKLIAFVQAHNLFRAPPVLVEHFTLFSSLLGKQQAFYVPEVEYDLGLPPALGLTRVAG